MAEVKQLKPGLHQAGLEYLLRYLLELEDERLRDREYELLASRIEGWIEFIWESDTAELKHALKKQGTTGQLVTWLDETCLAWRDSSLEPVIERLKQQTP